MDGTVLVIGLALLAFFLMVSSDGRAVLGAIGL